MPPTPARYHTSLHTPGTWPDIVLPAIAMVGRSNAGKSSWINQLLGYKNLAHTSSEPGKTAALNVYRIEDRFDIIDLPGYGFARVSMKERQAWKRLIERFLETYPRLHGAILVLDLRQPPSPLDLQMFAYLQARGIPTAVIASKADRLGTSKWGPQARLLTEARTCDDDHAQRERPGEAGT